MAPPDPDLCEDDSNTGYVAGASKRVRTRFLWSLPLASLAPEDGASALPQAECNLCLQTTTRPLYAIERFKRTVPSGTDPGE